jgi:hypothetical protein
MDVDLRISEFEKIKIFNLSYDLIKASKHSHHIDLGQLTQNIYI